MKASFLVDGFNLYHSLRTLNEMSGASVKWLDLSALCRNYLQAVRNGVGDRVELAGIHWFSARPTHMAQHHPDTLQRYDTYAAALAHTGVHVNISQFKRKDVTCPSCKTHFVRHEEKETDVAIAVKLLEVLVVECQTAVLVTGDTDLMPAIRMANRLFPRCKVGIAFPFKRHNNDLANAANFSFKINQKDLQRAQLPTEVRLPDGSVLSKPSSW